MKIRLQTSRLLIRDFPLWSFVALAAAALRAGDWPQYRGPNHDGISTETIRINWTEQPPRLVWKVSLGPALSSFTISNGRAFTQVRRHVLQADREFCVALDANTGAELWATELGA